MSNEVTNPENNAVSMFKSYNPADDYAEMRPQDYILPRIKLMQPTSEQCKSPKAGQAPKNMMGDFIETATNNTVIKAGSTGKIVVLGYWVEEVEWNVDRADQKNKIIRKSSDPTSAEFKQMAVEFERRITVDTPKGPKRKITEAFHFIVALPDYTGNYSDQFLLTFQRTGHRRGRELLNKMRRYKYPGSSDPVCPMFCAHWELGADVETNDRKEDYMVATIGEGTAVDPGWLPILEEGAKRNREARQRMIAANSSVDDEEEHAAPLAETSREKPPF